MEPIVVTREGRGPEILLVHGGASASTTWRGLAPLAQRWTLALAHRRGYPPSPPEPDGRHDFDVDAADLLPLLAARPHVVAHSYGGLGVLLAASRRPDSVRSLTLLEPALFLPPDDPEVARFERMGSEVLTHGLDTDPATLREFLRIAGADVDDGPLSPDVARGVRRAHRARLPREAKPDLAVLRDAGIPTLVVSGDHTPAIERTCDALAAELNSERLIVPGAGHFVAAAPGFASGLERFLTSVG
ncbi:MAG TPA: alpha/beta fold hydrolase [Solirubrobacteraceae bacterium]|nr:alpha/beta fold hydrolase [Solirubrobacteraceae bacterium]